MDMEFIQFIIAKDLNILKSSVELYKWNKKQYEIFGAAIKYKHFLYIHNLIMACNSVFVYFFHFSFIFGEVTFVSIAGQVYHIVRSSSPTKDSITDLINYVLDIDQIDCLYQT